jgi:glycine/D-amino acid oxidase-like deaminating enzyme
MARTFHLDVLILGGGAAGLWLLDSLRYRGYQTLLVECAALGRGQTVASQGIIHGGLKYMLDGTVTSSARAIAQMPPLWLEALAGRIRPDLRGVTVLSPGCHIWGTGTLASRVFLQAARLALRAAPRALAAAEVPPVLAGAGTVLHVPEPVLDPHSLLERLRAVHPQRVVGPAQVAAAGMSACGASVELAWGEHRLHVAARQVVLAAGMGNGDLRRRFGLPAGAMQLRPLHMAMLRGPLPPLYGHCVTGPKPRLTITTATTAGPPVWLVGGQLAEDGVKLDATALRRRLRDELRTCLPALNLSGVEAACYRVDRAEAATAMGQRPDDVQIVCEGPIITAWPTKLALVPRLAERIAQTLPAPAGLDDPDTSGLPAPSAAAPPWEDAVWERIEG